MNEHNSVVAVFPNAQSVRRLCKKFQQDTFSVDLVFACHASCGPNDLVIDLLGKFSVDFKYIQKVSYLADLPEGTFRKRQPYIAYTVRVTHVSQDAFDLHWVCRATAAYEAMIPKAIAEIPEIQNMLRDDQGPLKCKSIKRNSCFDVSNIGNCFSYVFSSACFDQIATVEAVHGLVAKCRDFADELPSSVIQVKPGVVWGSVDLVEKSVIFLRSLEPSQILELAQQLTLNRIGFYLPSPSILVLDLAGVPTASLVRLLHYSEIPIPTSMIQGAFSVSYLNWGKSCGDFGTITDSHTLQRFKVSCGCITALHSVPMQIKWEDIQQSCEPNIEQSKIPQWLKAECQGTCPTKVLAINEERTVDWYLQFFVPQKTELAFPKQVCFEGKRILIDHALPFAPIRSSISRPPIEETMHEHWKNTASLAPDQKRHHSNCLVHVEDCFPSLQRVNMLQEISIKSRGLRLTGSFEASSSPILYFNGVPKIEDGLLAFASIASQITDIASDVESSIEKHLQQPTGICENTSHSVTLYVLSIHCTDQAPLSIGRVMPRRNGCAVSTTELLKCHAFTECLLLVMLPKGIRIEGICTPKRHFEIVVRIPIVSSREVEKNDLRSPLTSLGRNPTQHFVHSQRTEHDKPSPSVVKRRSYVSPVQPQAELERERPSQSPVSKHQKNCNLAPQPVVVDGCGETNLMNHKYKDGAERGAHQPIPLPSYADSAGDIRNEGDKVLTQPVVVDGCGGQAAPVIRTDCSPWCVSTTAVWTAKPAEQSGTCGSGQPPEFTESRIKDGEQLKQCNKEGTKEDDRADDIETLTVGEGHQGGRLSEEENLPSSNRLQARLQTCQTLEPIPESDGYCANDEGTNVDKVGMKPKAFPLKVSKAVKQSLAKIAASGATQKYVATEQNGSKPVPCRSDDSKTLRVATGSPIEVEPTSTCNPHAPRPVSHSEKVMPDGKPAVQLRGSIRAVQRSRSAGHPPLTPNRKASLAGNSRSCPPVRLKSSPIKEVIKSGRKTSKDVSPGFDHDKKDNQGLKGKQRGPPLRRAGLDTSRKLGFFTKPDGIPKLSDSTSMYTEKGDGDTLMIDVESIIAADEIRKQTIAVEQVRDASSKWLTDYPNMQKNAIEQLAIRFLLTMNSTLCFFTVAMRMLSKAPWTESMVSVDVRQSALVAISRGWFVKNVGTIKYPFTRAELALAAGVYEGLITPTLPDDTTVALRTIIDHLPKACNVMFSRAEVTCPFCHAKSNGVVTTFSSCISWKDQTWGNLKQALSHAQPFIGYLPRNWHAEGCDRDDQNPKITKLGKWLYLELRPYPVLRNDLFPFLSESSSLILDDSLCTEGLYVDLSGQSPW